MLQCGVGLQRAMKATIYLRLFLFSLLYGVQMAQKINGKCVCGETSPLDVRIIGGKPTGVKEFPWQALILYMSKQHCDGSVINDRYILTAGHCVRGATASLFTVILGVHDRVTMNKGTERHFSVVQMTVHEHFLPREMHDLRDIALLKLNRIITYNDYIKPVCLPRQGESFSGKVATITGWGRTSYDGLPSRLLQKAVVRVLSTEECLKSVVAQQFAEDTETMFCAYGRNRDACQGDSGGPLVYTSPSGVSLQIGIISWGEKCGLIGFPAGYTKVSSFVNWIHDHTKDATYCKNFQPKI